MATSSRPSPVDRPNPNAGRYLRVILTALDGPDDEVRPSTLAGQLDVTPASVTGMTHHLAEEGLVDHEPYGGISLTPAGAEIAQHLQWRQCVLRRFFRESFDVELSATEGYEAGMALPDTAIKALGDHLDLDCRGHCDDRVWDADCGAAHGGPDA